MKEKNIKFHIKKLPKEQISNFFKLHDNDYFEQLSSRLDIDNYSKKLYENSLHFTLYVNNELIGFSPCYFNNKIEKVAYISSLTIKKEYRLIKLGCDLLEYIKEYAKNNSFNTIMVSINCNNKTSASFYKKNGFELADQDSKNNICKFKYIIF